MKKALLVATVLCVGMSFAQSFSTPAYAEENASLSVSRSVGDTDIKVNVDVKQTVKANVDWEKGNIVVMGVGLPPENSFGSQGMLLARRAAIVDGYRNLAETVQGVQVDSNTTVANMMVTSDVVQTNVNAVIKGAKIVQEGEFNGGYMVKMSLPLYGRTSSVAAAVLPEATKNIPFEAPEKVTKKATVLEKAEFKEARKLEYTGIVVDCRGLGLECTFAPQILDVNGREVYGVENIDKDFAVSQGMVEYSKDMDFVMSGKSRAGMKPLVVKAGAVKGGSNSVNPVNAILSAEDGDRALLAMQVNKDMLTNCAVVFVR